MARGSQAAARREPEAPAVHATKDSKATVVVACKMPFTWFEMQVCHERTVTEHTQTGPRDVKIFTRTGPLMRVRGTAYPNGVVPGGFYARPEIIGGYAITRNVPKDFWLAWSKQHAKADYLVNQIIIADESFDHLKGLLVENETLRSGMEPVKPDNDDRAPKPTIADVSKIETEENRKAAVHKAAEQAAY